MTAAQYARPHTVEDAAELLGTSAWQVFAGTTDVYPETVGRELRRPALDVTQIDSISGIEKKGDHWRVGACTTWTDIAEAKLPEQFDALQAAALQIGGIQIQNRGTIGGNVCTASPAGDGIPVLMSLSAEVEIFSSRGGRSLPIEEFITGYRQTALAADELLVAIWIPDRPGPSDFQKLGARSHLVISIAMVATHIEADADPPRPRIAVGACSPVAVRLRGLEGSMPDEATVLQYEYPELDPIDDVRGSAAYRTSVVGQLVARSVAACRDRL